MKKNTYQIAQELLSQYAQAHNIRITQVRLYMLEQVCQLPQPFDAKQLEKVCRPERISRATVYLALDLFVAAQILHTFQRQIGRTVTEYELSLGQTERMEFTCLQCGRTVNFEDLAINRLIREHKYMNFELEHYSLHVYGHCKICRKRAVKHKLQSES